MKYMLPNCSDRSQRQVLKVVLNLDSLGTWAAVDLDVFAKKNQQRLKVKGKGRIPKDTWIYHDMHP